MEKENEHKLTNNAEVTDTTTNVNAGVYVQDSALYDKLFLEKIAYVEPIRLLGKYCIVGNDTTVFPEDLPLNVPIYFKGANLENTFDLKVTRINLTSLIYLIKNTDNNTHLIDSISGKAVLTSTFFLAAEVPNDSETGDSYGATAYTDAFNGCILSISIGIGLGDQGERRAELSYPCKDFNCPTLRPQ